MSLFQQMLPPSGRDFEIFRGVNVLHQSQRQVAKENELSPTRIRQIVQKVGDFLGKQLLGPTVQPAAEQVVVARYLASERVDHLYGMAMRGFENSLKDKESLRRVSVDGKQQLLVETTQSSTGNVQFLNAALRYTLAAAKLPPVMHGMQEGLGEGLELGMELGEEEGLELGMGQETSEEEKDVVRSEEKEGKVQEGGEQQMDAKDVQGENTESTAAAEASNPPVGDCAPGARKSPRRTASRIAARVVKDFGSRGYDMRRRATFARHRGLISAAQQANSQHHTLMRIRLPGTPYFSQQQPRQLRALAAA